MAKWFRVPKSRFDRIQDLDHALEALRESKMYQQVRKKHRFDEDGDFWYGFLEAKRKPDTNILFWPISNVLPCNECDYHPTACQCVKEASQ